MSKSEGGLGFKILGAFNYAMLAKQTLITRLFRAKYFPKCGLLESRVGHNPSYPCGEAFGA